MMPIKKTGLTASGTYPLHVYVLRASDHLLGEMSIVKSDSKFKLTIFTFRCGPIDNSYKEFVAKDNTLVYRTIG